MTYQIDLKMAVGLLHFYLEKIYALDRHKGTSVVKVQRLFDLHEGLKGLIDQMRQSGESVDQMVRDIKESLEKKYQYTEIEVYVDGAARNNDDPERPNQSGLGLAVYGDSQHLFEKAVFLGSQISLPRLRNQPGDTVTEVVDVTNNVAEYMALIEALEELLQAGMQANHIQIYSDSSIVVHQVNMLNTTKAPHLITLRNCAQELMDEFDNITLTHIPREQNEYVDTLVNKMLDEVKEQALVG